jgi:hypothetical protein
MLEVNNYIRKINMNEIVLDDLTFSVKFYETVGEPTQEEVRQRTERVRCGMEPQVLIDEDLNVLDGLADLRAASEVPRSSPAFMILPGRSEEQKQALVQSLQSINKPVVAPPENIDEEFAAVHLSHEECLAYATADHSSRNQRTTTGPDGFKKN